MTPDFEKLKIQEREKMNVPYIGQGEILKEIIRDNPRLPLVYLASDEANTGDYSFMFCQTVCVEIGEILNCWQKFDEEKIYTDREDFRERVEDAVISEYEDLKVDGPSNEWLNGIVDQIIESYEPYWQKCILVYVGN